MIIKLIFILSFLNVTLLHCAYKWGWLQLGDIYIWKGRCYFCLAFWMAMIEILILTRFLTMDWEFIIIPFCAASITNFFINAALMHDNK